MVKDHSDNKRGNPLPPHGLLFQNNPLPQKPPNKKTPTKTKHKFKKKKNPPPKKNPTPTHTKKK